MDLSIFDPPEDHLGLDVLFWPSIDDQIELIRRRQAQIGRVLDHYTGNERDYDDLTRESTVLLAVVRTLSGVQQLTGKVPEDMGQSIGSNT